jgi:TonB family protein
MYCAEAGSNAPIPCVVQDPQPEGIVSASKQRGGNPLLQVFTFVLWIGCLAVGTLGFALPYARPAAPAPEPEPITAEFLNIELSNDPLPPEIAPASAVMPAPPLLEAIALPETAQPILVAEPSPAIAFALPVQSPTRVVNAAQATYSRSETTDKISVSLPVQTLTFGRGEGKQPAPEYPLQAKRQGQEGSVKVRLTVGRDGRVISAEGVQGSPWPLLNDAAIRTVQQRWRFSPGPLRLFEVLIHFQLNK